MAELDTCSIKNPSKEDFSARFNGELYTVRAGESKTYPKYLVYHLAKHLSNQLMDKEVRVLIAQYEKDSPYVPQVGALMNHDNPTRRKYLYDILGSKAEVESCLQQLQFKSFIGEMREYDKYVADVESANTSQEEAASPESADVPQETPRASTAKKEK